MLATVFIGFILGWATPVQASADTPTTISAETATSAATWITGKVVNVVAGETITDPYTNQSYTEQSVTIYLLEGVNHGKTVTVQYGGNIAKESTEPVAIGDTVVVNVGTDPQGNLSYYIVDHYRLPAIGWIFAAFVLVIVGLAWKRGATALVGLVATVAILMGWIIPQIVAGANPFTTSIIGAFIILVVSIYLAHGFSRRTTLAVISSGIVLLMAVGLAWLFTVLSHLSGAGTEEALSLQVGVLPNLNLQGLLLAGIIIGVLGVLDDITTAQAASVEELHKANPALTTRQLFSRGFSIGREHITSLVNTLVLAYVGASLPLFLLFTTTINQPWWVILNSEVMVEEVIRTLVGSMALVLAVPLTTGLAAYYYTHRKHHIE